jgi:hypothetical protein
LWIGKIPPHERVGDRSDVCEVVPSDASDETELAQAPEPTLPPSTMSAVKLGGDSAVPKLIQAAFQN